MLADGDVHRSGGCNDKASITKLRGTNGNRRDMIPLRIIPERGQITENCVESAIKKPWHVFQEQVARSK
jgi:hypothetical protein